MEPLAFETKHCPRCENDLLLSDFGICRSRKDGLNLYCKICIRQKIAIGRANRKEHNANRRARYAHKEAKSARAQARALRKLSPSDRVREAVRMGSYTQKEIIAATQLPIDEVTNHIAQLLLWSRDIRTAMIGGIRMYFINEGRVVVRRPPIKPREPQSYGVSSIYFVA